MAEESFEVQNTEELVHAPERNEHRVIVDGSTFDDDGDVAMKMEMAKEAFRAYSGLEHKPPRHEIWVWYAYELCSYFVHTVLIPIVFSLIISQVVDEPTEPRRSPKGLTCMAGEMKLYDQLTRSSISVGNSKVSPLEWTSISWAIGLVVAAPVLRFISTNLDHSPNQQLITGAATALGAFFCLPAGFFKVAWIFPVYIAPIVVGITIATASHTRHHGLMVRGFTGTSLQRHEFPVRRGFSSWLSLCATAAGCIGSAVIVSFVYYMLRIHEIFIGLWVVSIFSGLKWLAGIVYVIALRPGEIVTFPEPKCHFLSPLKYHHGLGSLIIVGLSSFTSMCIFTGGVLYLVGELCLKPVFLFYFWLIYFIFPSVALPLLQPVQLVLKASAVNMHLLGLILSMVTSGTGFQFRNHNWNRHHVLIFAAVQGTSAGVLHAFGRVLAMDCSPAGKEGAFSVWLSWVKMVGTCLGFAVASGSAAANVGTSFGTAFCTAAIAMVISIYGNISDVEGAVAAGHVNEEGLDDSNSMSMSISDVNGDAKKEPAGVAVSAEAA